MEQLRHAMRYVSEWLEDRRYIHGHTSSMHECQCDDELHTVLRELNVSPEQLGALEISPIDSLRLLAEMMRRLGIRDEDFAAGELEKIEGACLCCSEWRRCRRWLELTTEEGTYAKFCRNASAFQRAVEVRNAKGNLSGRRTCPG